MKNAPTLLLFLAMHALIGIIIGLGASAAVIWFDLAGLGTRFAADPGWLAETVFLAQMCLTFGAIQMGVAVMLLRETPDA